MNYVYLFCFLLTVSCASTKTYKAAVQKSNLTFAVVKKNLIKGKTTQAQIIQLLGSPNIITKDKNGLEIWSYNKQSFESGHSSSTATAFIPFLGVSKNKAFSQSASSSFDLILKFDSKDTLINYNVTVSKY